MNILVTGGSGFIGSTFLNMFVDECPEHLFVNADCLTYAANPQNLDGIVNRPNYLFELCDLRNAREVKRVIDRHEPDVIFHFAAETHVDRSIVGPSNFIQSNIVGTYNLLEAIVGSALDAPLLVHVSTDEVYGSAAHGLCFDELSRYDPSSPYAASKAAADHLVRAYVKTYGLRARITNCSNNYGPRQFPEKLVPLMIINAHEGRALPIYGDGRNIRDWLHVDDHCYALWQVMTSGRDGETYNIGTGIPTTNVGLVKMICQLVAEETGRAARDIEGQIVFVGDRPGHDRRYVVDPSKARREIDWLPSHNLSGGMQKTVRWYLENEAWVRSVQSGEYMEWIRRHYGENVRP